MKLRLLTFNFALLTFAFAKANVNWTAPEALRVPITQESKPYTRWWWLGSAVDKAGLTYNLEEMAKAGIGGNYSDLRCAG